MVEIEDELMAEHVIEQAREYGEYGDVYDTAYEGPYGEESYDVDWDLDDLDPQECTVDMQDDTVVVSGKVEGKYSVMVRSATYNPPGRAHPAEYENRTIDLLVEIHMKLGELPTPVIGVVQY